MQAFQPCLCLAQLPGMVSVLALRIGREGLHATSTAHLPPGGFMGQLPLRLHGKRDLLAICPLDQTDPLDLPDRAGLHLVLLGPNEAHAADTHAIRTGELLAIGLQLPARRFLFNRAIIRDKAGIALLAGFFLSAVRGEARHGEPGPICRRLAGLGVEAGSTGEGTGQVSTEDVQSMVANASAIHPEAHPCMANELDGPDRLINRALVGLSGSQLVLADQHGCLVCGLHLGWPALPWRCG